MGFREIIGSGGALKQHLWIPGPGRWYGVQRGFSEKSPPTLLVGVKVGTATVENNMEVPQKSKTRITI